MVKEGVIVVPAVRVGVPVEGETGVHPVARSGVATSESDSQMLIAKGEIESRRINNHFSAPSSQLMYE
jgi:hypothetical protein